LARSAKTKNTLIVTLKERDLNRESPKFFNEEGAPNLHKKAPHIQGIGPESYYLVLVSVIFSGMQSAYLSTCGTLEDSLEVKLHCADAIVERCSHAPLNSHDAASSNAAQQMNTDILSEISKEYK